MGVRTRRAAVVVAAALMSSATALVGSSLGLLRTERAAAQSYNRYCEILVDPHTRCPSTPGFTGWWANTAAYYGAGSISVCEKAERNGGAIVSRRCATDTVTDGSDLPASGNYWVFVGNNSKWRHTIWGVAEL